ncbi:MAG TPA: metallophosphoesterase, partial [Polyangiaceae bacterium]
GIGTGDFTDSATSTQWAYNTQIARALFDPGATQFGGNPRFLGAIGNHDILSSNWYSLWQKSLPGQLGLGHSGTDGVYFSTSYRNVLFAIMDSNMTSGNNTSYADAQTGALKNALAASSAQFKFIFYHKPVYSCSTSHEAYAPALPWLDLAETHNVDAIFSGHTHVYARTCRMNHGACTGNATGTVQVEVGTVGSPGPRTVNVSSASVTGTDALGAPRTDRYNCTSNLMASRSNTNDFCYVRVDDCKATVSCYMVGAGNTAPFDSWTIDHCG